MHKQQQGERTPLSQPRPSDAEIAAMLDEAAGRIVALCSKDIRKSFSDQNFAANTLRKTAHTLQCDNANHYSPGTASEAESAPSGPFCGECGGAQRLRRLEAYFWKCDHCGLECDRREASTSSQPATAQEGR